MQRAVVTILLSGLVLGGGGCGRDDVFPEDEFVSKLKEAGLEVQVGECVYAAVVDDKAVMADVVRAGGPNDDITAKSAEKLKRIVAKCMLGANPGS